MGTGAGRRARTRSDTYAIFDIRRQYDLDQRDCWVLLALERLIDFQTRCWRGSLTELAVDYLGTSRRAVSGSLARLETAGLVETIRPFTQGGAGTICLLAYDWLRDGNAMRSDPDRDAIASNDAINQPKEAISKGQGAIREKGLHASRATECRRSLSETTRDGKVIRP